MGSYISNEEEELNYKNLLYKIGLTDEELESNISFDIEIILTNKRSFKSNVEIKIPIDGIVLEGTTSKEFTDMDIVFKRTEN